MGGDPGQRLDGPRAAPAGERAQDAGAASAGERAEDATAAPDGAQAEDPMAASERLAESIARIASDRKASDIRVLDLRAVVTYTDFLVVCSGNSERQTKAIHDAIYRALKDELRLLPRRVEGEREARWILMDYLDCVVHVFTPEARAFYRLDHLWGEVPARSVV